MTKKTDERVQIESRSEWRAWLEKNHDRHNGAWLVTFKKHRGDKYVAYNDVVEEALCFGWIDSLPRKLDEDRTMLWMSPRKPGSGWSKLNKERVKKMTAAGQMNPAGVEKVEAAKQDGSWQALDDIEALEIPPDLEAAFASYTSARQNFDGFPRSVKRGILEWIANAKRPPYEPDRKEQ
jgi:uncharacterized protein YdeI (YjbR/CyaY-like superfamily)